MHGFSSIFHARFHRKNERNPVHSFYGLVHSFLRRCWFISKVLRLFRKIFAFFASYSAIIFDGLALGWYCNTADPKLAAYYRDESNYIQVVGEVTEIYDDPKYGITFALSNMNTKLDDICFRIRGKNADIVRKNDY